MIEDGEARPPHAAILAALVVFIMVVPATLADYGEAMKEFFAELLSPVGLFLLPVFLLLTIQYLSSESGSFISGVFATGGPDSIHRASGSPVGVTLFLLLVLFLLINRMSIFGGGGDDGDD